MEEGGCVRRRALQVERLLAVEGEHEQPEERAVETRGKIVEQMKPTGGWRWAMPIDRE